MTDDPPRNHHRALLRRSPACQRSGEELGVGELSEEGAPQSKGAVGSPTSKDRG
jgi:hypothetical protein